MEENQFGSLNKIKTIKEDEMKSSKLKIKNSSISYIKNIKKILNLLFYFGNIFVSLFNKINSHFSKCSILFQFSIFLIPTSLVMIIFIFYVHIYFYSNLYTFNLSKVFKEEFFDLYITKIDDLKTELTSTVVKETKIDIDNHLFFQIYFKELISARFFEEGKNYFQKFSDNKDLIYFYSGLNNIENADVNFTIDEELATKYIDDRGNDQLGKFAKIYYYMFPFIWYESFKTKSIINQSFFIAYEYGDRKEHDWKDDWNDDWNDDSEGEYDFDDDYDDSENEFDNDDSERRRRRVQDEIIKEKKK